MFSVALLKLERKIYKMTQTPNRKWNTGTDDNFEVPSFNHDEHRADKATQERLLKRTPDDARELARKIIRGEY